MVEITVGYFDMREKYYLLTEKYEQGAHLDDCLVGCVAWTLLALIINCRLHSTYYGILCIYRV